MFLAATGLDYRDFLDALHQQPLSPPLMLGTHYLTPDTRPTAAQTEALFANLARFAAAHSFQAFLESAVARTAARRAG